MENSISFINHNNRIFNICIKEEQSLLSSKLKTISLATTVTIMAVALVVFPQESFEASKEWLTYVVANRFSFLITISNYI